MGFVYTELGQAREKVLYNTCGGCRERICVPLRYIARCDGVLICPNCGEQEALSEARCRTIAMILARALTKD
jgi:predicted RNA-binding Zn-ribbon protein involved in translation (DUF1610 family)